MDLLGTCASALAYVSVPSCPTVFCEAHAPVLVAGVCAPLHLVLFVHAHAHASACMQPALVGLCSQRSSIAHVHVDPSCLLWRHSTFEPSFLDCSPPTLPRFSTVYTISV